MSNTRNAVIANLTFVLGQMEELKSNINDTMRYIKQNGESWDTDEDQKDSKAEPSEASEETPK